ncbi:endocuticle structural glycoprotein ABD-4-like [Athalia rosae]|uniref:endocuticle structural glycoprotein ABD-4-like n=1 Tax=Athalia rosae TaxID=37344 RepID=UPI002033DDBA|nr:endocuticle structural glycoprotein ABD-4-like [Athalia rosae]
MLPFTLVTLIAVCAAAPLSEEPIQIINQTQDGPNPDGSFNSAFETGNGIQSQQQGSLKQIDADTFVQVIRGTVVWPSPDGSSIQLTYVADEKGYQPQGNAIPVPPPIPVGIQRGLDFIAAHPPPPPPPPPLPPLPESAES